MPVQYGTSSAHAASNQGEGGGARLEASEELLANGHNEATVRKALQEAGNHRRGSCVCDLQGRSI